MPAFNRFARLFLCIIVLIGLTTLTGCGRGGKKLFPVKGRVTLAAGDIKVLDGSFVETALVGDTTVRASGIIQPDGTFKLETQENGSTRLGAPQGKFQVRIVLADEDAQKRVFAETAVAARYLDFNTSGVVIDVPVSNEVTITCVPENQ